MARDDQAMCVFEMMAGTTRTTDANIYAAPDPARQNGFRWHLRLSASTAVLAHAACYAYQQPWYALTTGATVPDVGHRQLHARLCVQRSQTRW
jgi:hypothetical protein